MVVQQKRSRRRASGTRYKSTKTRRQHSAGSEPTLTKLGARHIKTVEGIANYRKTRVMLDNKANIYNPKTKKMQVIAVKTILENPANKHFVRRNIMTKGTIIETEMGKARITSRPGQDGTINAVLL